MNRVSDASSLQFYLDEYRRYANTERPHQGIEGRTPEEASTARPQAELIDLDPETFSSSAYVGRFGWTTVDLERVDPDLLATMLAGAWRLTAPKRLTAVVEPGA